MAASPKAQAVDKIATFYSEDPASADPTPMLFPDGAGGTTDGIDFATYGGGFGGTGRWGVICVQVIISWFASSDTNRSEIWGVQLHRKDGGALTVAGSNVMSPTTSSGFVSFDNDGGTANFRVLIDPNTTHTIGSCRVIGVATDATSDSD